jgi:ribosomal protein S2
MEKGCPRMGIVYKYNFPICNNLKKYSRKAIENSFYTSLIYFAEQNKTINASVAVHVLGRRDNVNIVHPENHVEILRRTTKILYKIGTNSKVLFINTSTASKFDGIIKSLAYRAGQNFIVGQWPSGLLTKSKYFKTGGLLMYNSKQSYFAIKEANKLGIPTIGISSLDYNINKVMYPVFCNNLQGDSLFFTAYLLSNSILEGRLFGFIKNFKCLAI